MSVDTAKHHKNPMGVRITLRHLGRTCRLGGALSLHRCRCLHVRDCQSPTTVTRCLMRSADFFPFRQLEIHQILGNLSENIWLIYIFIISDIYISPLYIYIYTHTYISISIIYIYISSPYQVTSISKGHLPDGTYLLDDPPCNVSAALSYAPLMCCSLLATLGLAIAQAAGDGLLLQIAKGETEERRGETQAMLLMVMRHGEVWGVGGWLELLEAVKMVKKLKNNVFFWSMRFFYLWNISDLAQGSLVHVSFNRTLAKWSWQVLKYLGYPSFWRKPCHQIPTGWWIESM